MNVDYNGQKFSVRFVHERSGKTCKTLCRILRKGAFECLLVTYGQAVCGKKDQFEKEIGRKISLERALKSQDKPFRTAVWEAYFARKNPGVPSRETKVARTLARACQLVLAIQDSPDQQDPEWRINLDPKAQEQIRDAVRMAEKVGLTD